MFVSATRTVESQKPEDRWFRYSLDLGPAFDAAKAMGSRTLLDVPAATPAKAEKPEAAKPAAKPKAKKK